MSTDGGGEVAPGGPGAAPPVGRVACLGECMVELREEGDGRLRRGHGGDTLNTAVYLARLGVSVDYVTALGDDPWSDEMVRHWREEGIGTRQVIRVPGRLPGLYVIRTDAGGERRFSYWRESAPARDLFALPETPALREALLGCRLLYLTGVTLALYGERGRELLFETLDRARAGGGRIAFDTNVRPRLWPCLEEARAAFREALRRADVAFASAEDLDLLFGREGEAEFLAAPPAERVFKLSRPACRVLAPGLDAVVKAEPVPAVVDTTAAGDSFAAAYLAARLAGAGPLDAARAGHRLAGVVVGHPGAIIPRGAMPDPALPATGSRPEESRR